MDPAAFDQTEFILNAFAGSNYVIMRYVGRETVPTAPIISPTNNGGATHVAWPSAFRFQGNTLIFASRYINNRWNDVSLWISADGTNFALQSITFQANASEPYGIGPAQVFFDKTAASPWGIVYSVRNAAGSADAIHFADSQDGVTWVRRGPILTITEPFESAGVCPSWIMQTASGHWALFYHAYGSGGAYASAAVAVSTSRSGPFTSKAVIYSPNNALYTVTNGARLTNYASVSGSVAVGEPHLIRRLSGGLQITVPTRQVGSIVYFDEPLLADYASGPSQLSHMFSRKVDPSYAYEMPDGSWRGIFTGYGQWSDVTTEYTVHMTAPTITGPWTVVPGKVAFNPWNSSTWQSAENPAPVVNLD